MSLLNFPQHSPVVVLAEVRKLLDLFLVLLNVLALQRKNGETRSKNMKRRMGKKTFDKLFTVDVYHWVREVWYAEREREREREREWERERESEWERSAWLCSFTVDFIFKTEHLNTNDLRSVLPTSLLTCLLRASASVCSTPGKEEAQR